MVRLGKYQHYNGGIVEVLGIVRHSETLEELVFYKALDEFQDFGKGSFWLCPVKEFNEKIIVDGKEMLRFERDRDKSN